MINKTEDEIVLSRRKPYHRLTIRIEDETMVQVKKLISTKFTNINKSEFCRLAIEYCLQNKNFIARVKELD